MENLRHYEVRFTAPLSIGDTVKLSGEVTAVESTDGGLAVATMRLTATRDGTTLVSGQALVVVAGKSEPESP